MQVRLLGPVDVIVAGVVRPVAGLRRKAVLAVLGLNPGTIVSTDRLIDLVWGEHAPATAANSLQSHVSYLRRVVGSKTAIVTRPPGYLLDLPTDVDAAERLIERARAAVDPASSATSLRSALALWRGRPLADVAATAWFDQQSERLANLRFEATRDLVELRLALGEHAQVVPELDELAQHHPLDERVHGQLMRALYGSGRQADALEVYRLLRHRLDSDLGVQPGRSLREIESAILRQDPTLDRPASVAVNGSTVDTGADTASEHANPAAHIPVPAIPMPTVPVPAVPMPAIPVPAQLPMAVAAFAGRGEQLAQLSELLVEPGARTQVVGIATLAGTPGVGKTTLAIRWAHQVAAQFPDGQLYANLRGFAPVATVADPTEVVRGFLDALGVAPEQIPADPDARSALYRSTLAGRRVLVVLDNARDAAQVRPLLPGTGGCAVVVTSRNQLTALAATEGAHPLALDVLSTDEARELLTGRLGPARVDAEPRAVDEIITRCARLPLALSIAAARASARPGFTLAQLAGELGDSAYTLDALDTGDPATTVRSVFFWSYTALDEPAARMFRLLGQHAGPDFGPPAAASLANLPLPRARALLAGLTSAHLLTQQTPDRYCLHDLLRSYAGELAGTVDSRAELRFARHRMLDHYLRTAWSAARLLNPHGDPIELATLWTDAAPGRAGAVDHIGPQPANREQALGWLNAEGDVLFALMGQASGFEAHLWQLAYALTDFFERRGYWSSWVATAQAGLRAARALADPLAEAYLHRSLGRARMWQSRYDDAQAHFTRALELFADRDDRIGQGRTHHNLSQLAQRRGSPHQALHHGQLSLEVFRAIGDRAAIAKELNTVGWCHAELGHYHRALELCGQAQVMLRELGDLSQEGATWDSLGFAHHRLGDLPRAIDCYRHTVELAREMTDRYCEATGLRHLGDAYLAHADPGAAVQVWREALKILDDLRHPDAGEVRAALAATARDS